MGRPVVRLLRFHPRLLLGSAKAGGWCVSAPDARVPTLNSVPTMKPFLASLLLSLTAVGTAVAAWPINDVCPVDAKPARPIYRVKTEAGMVAFCCTDCMQAFNRSPGRYPVKRKEQ